MVGIKNYTDDPAELAIEARGALRACVALADEFDGDRFEKDVVPIDPRDSAPEHRAAAINTTLLRCVSNIAGLGCLRDTGHQLDPQVASRLLPFVQSVQRRSSVMLDTLEEEIGKDSYQLAGFGDALDLLCALMHATEAALALWGVG